jgi:hypothetical protein
MTFDEVKVGEKYKLGHEVQFYNHREGTFAYFDDELEVEVYRKNSGYVKKTVMVKFPGARIEIYPSSLRAV